MRWCRNPFQGGVGFSTSKCTRLTSEVGRCRNPFQGGVGFSTLGRVYYECAKGHKSQSLSGWGGVFNNIPLNKKRRAVKVAIPFRVGWGFQRFSTSVMVSGFFRRNPFQGGVGFSTVLHFRDGEWILSSQSLSGWGGVFNGSPLP